MFYFGPYSDRATKVFNAQHSMIPNADSITGESWYNELALLPMPHDSTNKLFYLFSAGQFGTPNPGMYFTTIDMNLNGGLGGLLEENVQLDNISHADCLTSIKHGNGLDWWIISKKSSFPFSFNNRFYVYHVSRDTVKKLTDQDFNDMSDGAFSRIIWHPSGNKFMLINVMGYMKEFDFDRCTGAISLNRMIYAEQSAQFNRIFFEGSYSPNGNVFYISRNSYGGNYGDYNYLLQYDLTANDIPNSCDTLDSTMYPMADNGAVRLAPNGKIYYTQSYAWGGYPYPDSARNYINENLGVVNDPNVVGSGCNFIPFSFYLGGKRTYYGLPNNPNYSLGPLVGSPCDTLTVGIVEKQKNAGVFISPNPATSIIYFNAQNLKGKQGILNIVSVSGERVFQKPVEILNGGYATQRIDVNYYPSGIYFVSFQTERESVSGKFVKE